MHLLSRSVQFFQRVFKAAVLNLALILSLTMTLSSPVFPQAPSTPIKLVAFGDSLTAGYLLKNKDAFPAQLGAALAKQGIVVEIINSGVSGDTTADGLARLEWAVPLNTEAVILELGANDALRGQSPEEAKKNLEKIITSLQKRNIEVLLAGMKSPKNWGEQYAKHFDGIFKDLAQKYNLPLYPFFLEGVALNPTFVFADGLHPNEQGVAEIVRRILPKVQELLERTAAKKTGKPVD